MLQAMRNGMNSWITKSIFSLLLLLALGGLVLSDTGGFFRGGVNKGSVAKIGGQEVSFVEFDKIYRTAIDEFPYKTLLNVPEYRYALAKETLQKEIETRIVGLTANDLGLVIDDKIAAKNLREYLKPLTEEGNMLDKTALQYILQKRRISEDMLVNNIKNQTAIRLLMSSITAPVHPSKQMIFDIYQIENEMRSAHFTKIKYSNFKVGEPSDDDVRKFYLTNATKWMTDEYRKISILKITPEAVLEKEFGKNAITDKDVKELYDARLAEFTEEDKKNVAIATFKKEEDANRIFKFLKKNPSKNLKEALNKNKDIVAIYMPAEEYIKSNILPAELAEPTFNFKKDKGAVAPVKSALGWHLAFIEKTVRGKVTEFTSVKDKLRQELVIDKSSDALFELINELEDMFAAGDTAKEAGSFLNLPVSEIPPISNNFKDIDGKEVKLDELEKAGVRYAFSQKPDEYIKAELHELGNGSFIAVSVSKIIPPQKKPFETVKKEVIKEWQVEEQKKQAQKMASKIIAEIKNKSKSLKEFDKEKNIKISYMPLKKVNSSFTGDNNNSLPKEFLAKLADIKAENDVISFSDNEGVIVTQLEKIFITELPNKEEEFSKEQLQLVNSIRAKLEENLKNEIAEQYLNAQIAKYGVKINEYSFEKKYGVKAQKEEISQY